MLADLEVSRAYPARSILFDHDGDPLELRPTRITDAEEIARAIEASLEALRAFMPWAHRAQTARSQLERLRGAEADYLAGREMAMALFRGTTLLAIVGLHPRVPLNPKALEIGYWAPTPHAGRGFTTLAVRIATVYAFDKLGADRVQVMCDEANIGSRRVIEKCGFVLEGVLRNVTEPATPELVRGGYRATGRTPMFGLFPDTFGGLPWVAETRERMTYVNLGGYHLPR